MSESVTPVAPQKIRVSVLAVAVFVLSALLSVVCFDIRQSYFALVSAVDSESKAKVKSWQMYLNIGNVLKKMDGTLTEIKHEQTETRRDIRELREAVEEKPKTKN